MLERTLELARRVLGHQHPNTLTSMTNLGALYERQGRFNDALLLYSAATVGVRSSLRPGHRNTGRYLREYGRLLVKLERYAEAERPLLESQRLLQAALGAEHQQTIETIRSLVDLYNGWGKRDKTAGWQAKLPKENPTQ